MTRRAQSESVQTGKEGRPRGDHELSDQEWFLRF